MAINSSWIRETSKRFFQQFSETVTQSKLHKKRGKRTKGFCAFKNDILISYCVSQKITESKRGVYGGHLFFVCMRI